MWGVTHVISSLSIDFTQHALCYLSKSTTKHQIHLDKIQSSPYLVMLIRNTCLMLSKLKKKFIFPTMFTIEFGVVNKTKDTTHLVFNRCL